MRANAAAWRFGALALAGVLTWGSQPALGQSPHAPEAPGPTFLAANDPALSNGPVTWPATWKPESVIRVWFEDVGRDFQDMVWAAFESWADARVPLTVVPAASISDANVLVMESPHPLDRSPRLGQTTIRGSGETIETAVIRFSRIDRHGQPIPRGIRARAALHEVGHVLGLGHGARDRIMHGAARADRVTLGDLADLGRLYGGHVTSVSAGQPPLEQSPPFRP